MQTVRAPELSYSSTLKAEYAASDIKFNQAALAQGQVNSKTIPAGSLSQYIDVEIPPKVPFYPAQCEVEWDVNIDAQAALYTHVPMDTIGELYSITWKPANKNIDIARVDFANKVLKATRKIKTMSAQYTDMTPLTGLTRSELPKALNYTMAPAQYVAGGAAGGIVPTASKDLIEPLYVKSTNAVATIWPNGAAAYQKRRFPLSVFSGTMFAENTLWCFPVTTIIRLTFCTQIGSASNSPFNPAAGGVALTGNVNLANFRFWRADEVDDGKPEGLCQQAISAMAGREVSIPFLSVSIVPAASGPIHDVHWRLSASDGHHLKRLTVVPFPQNDTAHYTFDHSNNVLASGVKTQGKILTYDIFYNSKRAYPDAFACYPINAAGANFSTTQSDDYRVNKNYLFGSVLMSEDQYKQNWFHCESFMGFKNPAIADIPNNIEQGVKLTETPLDISLKATLVAQDSASANLALQYAGIYETLKTIKLSNAIDVE